LDQTPGAVKGPQPLAGAHTAEIFESLGHDARELSALRAKGVI
jgi:crotonobetainyl-CoA:carnitine CoA-transferase CaiB-like acyl-CoA transferase